MPSITKHTKHGETHRGENIGWLRAAVLGANDGLISTASLLTGLASAGMASSSLVLTGMAALVAGAMSMAAGEYVSVSSQADTERADIAREREELGSQPDQELNELAHIYQKRGLSTELARQVAVQLTAHDALGSHLRDELGLTELAMARPLQAAVYSAIAFSLGALPTVALAYFWMGDAAWLPWMIVALSTVTLVFLGAYAARLGGANMYKGAGRVVFWGLLAMGSTAIIGRLFGANLT